MSALTLSRPWFLVLAMLSPAMWAGWRHWPPPLTTGRSRAALALRLALLTVLVAALAGVRITRHPDRRALMAVVDLSDSTRGTQDRAADAVRSLVATKHPADIFGMVTFGRDAQVELSPTTHPSFDGFQTRPDGGYTDIAGALRLAANLAPAGYRRQLVLISDGRQNLGDAAAAVTELRSDGVRVDVLALGAAPSAEALVAGLDAPSQVPGGQTVTASARLRSTGQAQGTLALEVDGVQVEDRSIALAAGDSAQAFTLPALAAGVHRLRATLDAQPDTYSENNVAEAVVRVVGPPSVLVLEGSPGEGANVAAALGAAGMQVETRAASQAPTDVAALLGYDSIVVDDAPTRLFPANAQAAIASAVRDLGRGLVTIGGAEGYGAGGWGGTPLEDALPVRMQVNDPTKNAKVAVALVLETMEDPAGDAVATSAIQGLLDKLTPTDEVAVVGDNLVVSMTPAADKAAIARRIGGLQLSDPPSYLPRLETALASLRQSDAAVKHIVLIGDGDANGDEENYPALFAEARAEGVTISTVDGGGDGGPAGQAFMASIAQGGGGVSYPAPNTAAVPELLFKESQRALRPWFEEGAFFPAVTTAGDILAGVPLDSFPGLDGYVATTAKGNAEVALTTPKGDPLLADWQYGLGRAVAWTSDASGRWTGGFLTSAVSGVLFAHIVAWSMPLAIQAPLAVAATLNGDGLDVTVTGPETGGDVRVQVVAPDLNTITQPLAQVTPGNWQGTVGATQVGTYVLHGVLQRAGTDVEEGEATLAVPYSPEYFELGRDDPLLNQLVRVGGGSILGRPAAAWSMPVPQVATSGDLFWALLLLAVLLWPVDIALRRLTLTRRQLVSMLGSLAHGQRPTEIDVALPPSLARARERVEARRRSRNGSDAAGEDQTKALADAARDRGIGNGATGPARESTTAGDPAARPESAGGGGNPERLADHEALPRQI